MLSRATRGTTDPRSRRSTGGSIDIQDVDQAMYRGDLGFKMTNDAYGQYMGARGQFLQEYGNTMASNQSALSQNRTALGEIDKYVDSLNSKADELYVITSYSIHYTKLYE